MADAGENSLIQITRRELLARVGAGVAALTVETAWGALTPAEARQRGARFNHLTAAEGAALEALGETLLPGAARAGIAHFVDDQLGRPDPLLFLKYMDWPGPPLDFYRKGLAALDRLAEARHQRPFAACTRAQKNALVGEISAKQPDGWTGPPASLFYFVVRNDAVDVVYGTPGGFAKLRVPYMAHVEPPAKW
jgi:hypothetical protein